MHHFKALARALGVIYFCLWLLFMGGCKEPALKYTPVIVSAERLEIPLAIVSDGAVHFFSCRLQDRNIDFFVRSDRNGRLSVYFDACYSCCKYRRGYLQEKGRLICRACRVGFDLSSEEWDFIGACTPVKIRSRVAEELLVISRRDLERGVLFF